MDTLATVGIVALAIVFLGRSAVIAFLPGSGLSAWCEERLGFLDTAGDGDGADGGDGGGD